MEERVETLGPAGTSVRSLSLVAPPPDLEARTARSSDVKLRLVLVDLLTVVLAAGLSIVLLDHVGPTAFDADAALRTFLISLPVWPIAFTHQMLYRARFIARGADEAWRVTKAVLTGSVALTLVAVFTEAGIHRSWFPVAGICILVTVGIERTVARSLFRRARRRGNLLRRVVIVGANAEGRLVREMLDADPSHGYEVVGFLEDIIGTHQGETGAEALRNADRAVTAVQQAGASGVIIAATAMDLGTSNRLIRACTEEGIHVELSSTLCDIAADRLTVRPLGRFPMVYVEPIRRDGWRARAKRASDLVLTTAALVLLSPLLLVAAAAVRLGSPGPVIFRQVRIGRDGEPFEMLKFRTMVVDAEQRLAEVRHLNEANGPLFKIRHDPRVTRVGRILRKTSVDELPQLVNVLRGEMSLVGPRPALRSEVDQWDPGLRNRLRVKPGITGMWQVSGRSDASDDYGQLDLYYVDNWNLVTDLVILARTVPAVLLQKGSY
jgi:exopolysaccharide biosynthesis polyprenyl glycosylphosphotransferase